MARSPKPKPRRYFAAAERAREAFNSNIERYAKLHLTAARKAAARGDSRPCEFALTHVRVPDEQGNLVSVIAPSIDRPNGPSDANSQPKIIIGIGLGSDFDKIAKRQPSAVLEAHAQPADSDTDD